MAAFLAWMLLSGAVQVGNWQAAGLVVAAAGLVAAVSFVIVVIWLLRHP